MVQHENEQVAAGSEQQEKVQSALAVEIIQSEDGQDDKKSGEGLSKHQLVVPEIPPKGIESGKYCLVGWGIDTTGRRLIDEICQLAAYTPTSQFSQYIMPFGDINPWFKRKHNIRVVNTLRYRMLRDDRLNKFVKTKSDYIALTEFLAWLEEVSKDTPDGVILVYYEMKKASPAMLLESLRRYQLLERFEKTVKGFANGFTIAQAKCANTTKSLSLRVVSKVLLNKDDDEDYSSAVDRAKAHYEICAHLAQGERESLDDASSQSQQKTEEDVKTETKPPLLLENELSELVAPLTNPVSAEEEEITKFKELLNCQNTFRPIFGNFLRAGRVEREHASYLRRLLAENKVNFEALKTEYETGSKEALEKLLISQLSGASEADITELVNMFDCYFDPEKKAIQPKVVTSPNKPHYYSNTQNYKTYQNNNERRPQHNNNNYNRKFEPKGRRRSFPGRGKNSQSEPTGPETTNSSANVSSLSGDTTIEIKIEPENDGVKAIKIEPKEEVVQ